MPKSIVIAALSLALAIIIPASVYAAVTSGSDAPAPAETATITASEDTSTTETHATTDDGDDGEKAAKPWVGLYVMNLSDRVADKLEIDATEGVVVIKVVEDGPAAAAGIEKGDVILSVGDTGVSNVADVRQAVGEASIGDTLSFTVERDRSESTYDVTAVERPTQAKHGDSEGRKRTGEGKDGEEMIARGPGIGATVANLNDNLAGKLEIEATEGVVIVGVRADGPADDAGLRKGDIIVSVDGDAVDGVAGVVSAVREGEAGDTLALVVDRDGEDSNLTIDVTLEDGYGAFRLRPGRFGSLRGGLSRDDGVSIVAGSVTVTEIGEDSVVLTPDDGGDDITANVGDGSRIIKDGEMASLSDLAVDDEGNAIVVDGQLKLLLVGSLEDVGKRFRGRFGNRGNDSDGEGSAARRFSPRRGGVLSSGTIIIAPGAGVS